MRYFMLCGVFVVGMVGFSPFAQADNFTHDFGPYFYGQTPQALKPFPFARDEETLDAIAMDESIAEELQAIMPAAGEEDEALKPDEFQAVQSVSE